MFFNSVEIKSMQKAHSRYPTVLDMLDVQDVDILNTLIDQCSIESVLLIEDGQEAFRVIDRDQPTNAKSVSARALFNSIPCS